MNRSIQSRIAMAALAMVTLTAAAAANAATNVHISVGMPAERPVYVAPPVNVHAPYPGAVHVPAPRPVYDRWPGYGNEERYGHEGRYGYEGRYGHDRGWRSACAAPRWDPNVRYMPGHTVWRKGTLYRATRLSASVYNENSPPEWTPSYWRPVRCV